jgi:ribosomal protein L19
MKKRRTSNIPLSLKIKIVPLRFQVFWKFVDCIQMAGQRFKHEFIPTRSHFDVIFECDSFFSFLEQKKKEKLLKLPTGSLVGCVFTSKQHHMLPIMQRLAEIQTSKIRTFFGHIIRKRNRKTNTNILLRVSLAGELFLFRIFPYAPNILSFYLIKLYQRNLRSNFYFKILNQQKNLRASRSGNV